MTNVALAPRLEFIASAGSSFAPAPVVECIAPAASCVAPAPVIECIATSVSFVTPVPVDEHIAPAAYYVTRALVDEHIASAASYVAPAPDASAALFFSLSLSLTSVFLVTRRRERQLAETLQHLSRESWAYGDIAGVAGGRLRSDPCSFRDRLCGHSGGQRGTWCRVPRAGDSGAGAAGVCGGNDGDQEEMAQRMPQLKELADCVALVERDAAIRFKHAMSRANQVDWLARRGQADICTLEVEHEQITDAIVVDLAETKRAEQIILG